ncbi:MAG: DUF2288 domain-containing protein [Herminiimonas sp.]|nr:DUF2288 domain-containing protein [Herminiimonas sp.]
MPLTFDPTDPLRVKLNAETARLHWHELLRHFAAGLVVLIDDGLDLIEVAVAFTNDDKLSVEKWMLAGQVAKASDSQAAAWLENDARMWTVVVRPWILVQVRRPGDAVT